MICFLPGGNYIGGLVQVVDREIASVQSLLLVATNSLAEDGHFTPLRKEHWVSWTVKTANLLSMSPEDFLLGQEAERLLLTDAQETRSWVFDQITDLRKNYEQAKGPDGSLAVWIPADDEQKQHWHRVCKIIRIFYFLGVE